jgi:hypothetical protein
MIDLSGALWKKASRSTGSNGGCVEIAVNLPSLTAIRDSKRPDDGAHVIEYAAFRAFLCDVKDGRYNI